MGSSTTLQAFPLHEVSETLVSLPVFCWTSSVCFMLSEKAYVMCQEGRLLNDLTRLSCVTWNGSSTADRVFTESILKVVLPSIFLWVLLLKSQTLSFVYVKKKTKLVLSCHPQFSPSDHYLFCTSKNTSSRHSPPHGYQLLQIDSWVLSTNMPRFAWITIYSQPWPTIQSHFLHIKLS